MALRELNIGHQERHESREKRLSRESRSVTYRTDKIDVG